MGIAALVAWLVTALGGFFLLGTWIAKGGIRAPRTSHFPPALILGHFALAAAGLVIWIVYLIADSKGLAWTAFVLMIPVALLGFVMLFRWIPTYRARSLAAVKGPGTTGSPAPAEQHFPVPVVIAHGLFAVTTVVLVLITAIGAQ